VIVKNIAYKFELTKKYVIKHIGNKSNHFNQLWASCFL